MTPETCPNCGTEVPPRAKACPECGADETTGWSEKARSDDLGLPDADFDYEEFVKREFGKRSPLPHGLHWFWWLVAAVMAGILIWYFIK